MRKRTTVAMRAVAASTALLAGAIAGCSSKREPPATTSVEVSGVYISEPALGERAAMYFTVVNHAGEDDELLAVSTPVAGVTEIHRTVEQAGTMRMEPVASLPLPAGGELRIAPGGYHIMLLEMRADFAPGDSVDVTLHFRNAGDVAVRGQVLKYVDIEQALTGAH